MKKKEEPGQLDASRGDRTPRPERQGSGRRSVRRTFLSIAPHTEGTSGSRVVLQNRISLEMRSGDMGQVRHA